MRLKIFAFAFVNPPPPPQSRTPAPGVVAKSNFLSVAVMVVSAYAGTVLADDAQGKQPAIVGSWRAQAGQATIITTYTPHGQYSITVDDSGKQKTIKGNYALDGHNLTVTIGSQTIRRTWSLFDKDVLELVDPANGNRSRLVRLVNRGPDNPGNIEMPAIYRQIAPNLTKVLPSLAGHILFSRVEMVRVSGGGQSTEIPVPKIYIMAGDGAGISPFIAPPGLAEARQPCWSADGGRVVFTSNFEMGRSAMYTDIFHVDMRKGVTCRITGNEWSAGAVAGVGEIHGVIEDLTGGGKHKAGVYISWQGGGGQVINPDGWYQKDQQQGAWGFTIKNVPAGQVWVKAWTNKHQGDWKLVVVPAGGVGTVEMNLKNGNFLATDASVTVDGRYIVGLSQHPYWIDSVPDHGEEHPTRVPTHEQGFDTMAVWDTRRGGLPVAMWEPTKMRGMSAKDPKISPNGKTIAFACGNMPDESLAVCSLASFLAGQSDVRVIVQGQTQLGVGAASNTMPAWSPDGNKLAFCRTISTANGFSGTVFVVNADGTGLRQLARVAANQLAGKPTWSPDGSKIAFQVITSKRPVLAVTDMILMNIASDIFVIDANGGNAKQLTQDGRSGEPAWGL